MTAEQLRMRRYALRFILGQRYELKSANEYAHDLAEVLIPVGEGNLDVSDTAREVILQIVISLMAGSSQPPKLRAIAEVLRSKERLSSLIAAPQLRHSLSEPSGYNAIATALQSLNQFAALEDERE